MTPLQILFRNTIDRLLDLCDNLYFVCKNQVQIFLKPQHALKFQESYQTENATDNSALVKATFGFKTKYVPYILYHLKVPTIINQYVLKMPTTNEL